MCGIVGILGLSGPDTGRREIVRRMAASLIHRGPDGEGFCSSGPCELGFRRLAIVDVEASAEPLSNEAGNVRSVCNGEVYNAAELRTELEAKGHRLRTGVDTELIPHLYEEHGADLFARINGMFAVALWDGRDRTLILGRDRAGEKPLFYWQDRNELVFSSEIGALLAHPRVSRKVDPLGLQRYLLHGFFPAPLTPLAGVYKLPAAHRMIVRDGRIELSRYWDLADHFNRADLAGRKVDQVADELDDRISVAVRRRRRSDVPVGVFLSGGLDSANLLAHCRDQAGPGVPAFSLGHVDRAFDETRFARETARLLDADYHELVLGEAELAEGLRIVGESFDEPLGDASTLPTTLLARFASREVKVVLSGEGADEIFGGYPTYIGHRVASAYRKIPRPLRRLLASVISKLTPTSMGNVGADYLLERFLSAAECDHIERHHRWFGSLGPERIAAVLSPSARRGLDSRTLFGAARELLAGKDLGDRLSELLYTDFSMYLQDGLLTKVDRSTMLASVEARGPYLDHELAEFVAGLPSHLKIDGMRTKVALRRAAAKRVPREVLARRKRGFNIPLSRWLLHGLGDELKERFSTERIEARGLLSAPAVHGLLDEHLERRRDHRKPIFALLALDLWCDRTFGDGARVPVHVGLETGEASSWAASS